jgi:hypothetical protein
MPFDFAQESIVEGLNQGFLNRKRKVKTVSLMAELKMKYQDFVAL